MHQFDQPWLEQEPEQPAHRTRTLLIAGLVAPWVVVAAVLVLARGSATPAGGDAVELDEPAGGLEVEAPAVEPLSPLEITQIQGAWRSAPGPSAAGAIAELHAREWLQGAGIGTWGHGGADMAVEHLTVEAVEQLDDGVAVATLIGTVTTTDGQPTRLRLAVPVRIGGPLPTAAGAPWVLPVPHVEPRPLTGRTVDDPAHLVAATEALVDAGYIDVEVVALEQTDSWPWRAQVRARTPSGVAVTSPVLLRRHLDGFAVAGIVHPEAGS